MRDGEWAEAPDASDGEGGGEVFGSVGRSGPPRGRYLWRMNIGLDGRAIRQGKIRTRSKEIIGLSKRVRKRRGVGGKMFHKTEHHERQI